MATFTYAQLLKARSVNVAKARSSKDTLRFTWCRRESKLELNQVTLPCTQYEQSLAFYRTLGFTLIVDSPPRYARFETAQGTTFSLHTEGVSGKPQDTVVYFEVDDVDETVGDLKSKGIDFEVDPVDQEWGWREAYTRDPSGNSICIYHAGDYRRFPPWRVKDE